MFLSFVAAEKSHQQSGSDSELKCEGRGEQETEIGTEKLIELPGQGLHPGFHGFVADDNPGETGSDFSSSS